MRDITERPEGVKAGILRFFVIKEERTYREFTHLLNNLEEYNEMTNVSNLYGDGHTSERIVDILKRGYTDSVFMKNGFNIEKRKMVRSLHWVCEYTIIFLSLSCVDALKDANCIPDSVSRKLYGGAA